MSLASSAARSITFTAPLVNCTPPKMPSIEEEAEASAASSARRMASPSARGCRSSTRCLGGRGCRMMVRSGEWLDACRMCRFDLRREGLGRREEDQSVGSGGWRAEACVMYASLAKDRRGWIDRSNGRGAAPCKGAKQTGEDAK